MIHPLRVHAVTDEVTTIVQMSHILERLPFPFMERMEHDSIDVIAEGVFHRREDVIHQMMCQFPQREGQHTQNDDQDDE